MDEAVLRIRLEEGNASARQRPTQTGGGDDTRAPMPRPAGRASRTFDADAEQRRQAEWQREQAKTAYRKKYGTQKEEVDQLTGLLKRFSPALGAAMQAALSLAAAMRAAQVATGLSTPKAGVRDVLPAEVPTLEAYEPQGMAARRPLGSQSPEDAGPALVKPPARKTEIGPSGGKVAPSTQLVAGGQRPASLSQSQRPQHSMAGRLRGLDYEPTGAAPMSAKPVGADELLPTFDESQIRWDQAGMALIKSARATPGVTTPPTAAPGSGPWNTPHAMAGRLGGLEPPTLEEHTPPPKPEEEPPTLEEVGPGGMGLTEAASVAGPIVAAIVIVNKALLGMRDNAVAVARGLGDAAVNIAKPGNTFGEDAEQMGGAIHAVGDKIWVLGPAVSALYSVTGEAVSGLGRFARAVDASALHYGQYSPVLAVANAQAEMRQIYGDFRRAQQLGPNLGAYVNAKSRLEQHVEDIKATLLNKILPYLTAGVNAADALLTAGEKEYYFAEMIYDVMVKFDPAAANEAWKKFLKPPQTDFNDLNDPTSIVLKLGSIIEPPV